MDEKDTIDSYVQHWLGINNWFNPCSSEYNHKLSLAVLKHSFEIEQRFHKEGKQGLIMNSKEYFDEIDKYVLSLKSDNQSAEYEVEMKTVGLDEIDEIIKAGENSKEDGAAKVAEALNSTKYDRDKLYIVDGQIALFKLEAPEGWEYFLGREEICWNQLNDKTKRFEEQREFDQRRMHELKAGGWTAVPADRYPELEYFHADGALKYKGLVLLERPKSIGDAARVRLDALNDSLPNYRTRKEDLFGELDLELPKHIKQPEKVYWEDDEEKKSLFKKFISFFKREKRHYYARSCGHSHPSLFPRARRFTETIQFKYRFGKYKLDWEEKQVCRNLEITEESYIREKYKLEMEGIY